MLVLKKLTKNTIVYAATVFCLIDKTSELALFNTTVPAINSLLPVGFNADETTIYRHTGQIFGLILLPVIYTQADVFPTVSLGVQPVKKHGHNQQAKAKVIVKLYFEYSRKTCQIGGCGFDGFTRVNALCEICEVCQIFLRPVYS